MKHESVYPSYERPSYVALTNLAFRSSRYVSLDPRRTHRLLGTHLESHGSPPRNDLQDNVPGLAYDDKLMLSHARAVLCCPPLL